MVPKKGHTMEEKEKGILGKLLSLAGAILVVAGVFVFQNASHAEDPVDPASVGGVGVVANPTGDPEDPEDPEEPETTDPVVANDFSIKYYKATEYINTETGAAEIQKNIVFTDALNTQEVEHEFIITSSIPDGEGTFLAWYDETNDKYYTAGDPVTLTAENPTLELVAKFDLRRTFTLQYDGNGGENIAPPQTCDTNFDTCEFVISNIIPYRNGYEFRGWQKGDDNSVLYSPGALITHRSALVPLTLKATWAEIKTYTLIYEGNGGSGAPEAQICRSADGFCTFQLSDQTPTRASFEFLDWQNGITSVGPGAELKVTETSTILVANWEPVAVFTLEYVSDDSKDVPEPQKCESSMGTCTFIIPQTEPTREGYRFKGWQLEGKEDMLAQGGDELIVDIEGPLNLRILAVWAKIHTVLNSGEVFGVGERVVLRSSAEYGEFKKLTIDDEEVPAEYYILPEGNATSIILSNAFSQSLTAGEHGFTMYWEHGEADGVISVNQSEDGTKRFVVVDAKGTADGMTLMYRPKAGAVSKESTRAREDAATESSEGNFDAMRTLIFVAVGVFVVIYVVNKFYLRRKMDFIENF